MKNLIRILKLNQIDGSRFFGFDKLKIENYLINHNDEKYFYNILFKKDGDIILSSNDPLSIQKIESSIIIKIIEEIVILELEENLLYFLKKDELEKRLDNIDIREILDKKLLQRYLVYDRKIKLEELKRLK